MTHAVTLALFKVVACLATIAGIAAAGLYVGSEVMEGRLPWWPYAGLLGLMAAIFALYGALDAEARAATAP